MKVNEVMKKINSATAQLPVYLQEGIMGTPRKAESWDFNNYYYDEKERTLMSISILKDKVIIYYK